MSQNKVKAIVFTCIVLGILLSLKNMGVKDPCSPEMLLESTKNTYLNINKTSKGQKNLENLQNIILKNGIKKEDLQSYTDASLRAIYMMKNNCPISKDIGDKYSQAMGFSMQNGTKECPAKMYLEEARKEFFEIKSLDVFKNIE